MRLTEFQGATIKAAVSNVIDTNSRIWLFGSRADDTKRGGDIDLLIETENVLPNRVAALCRLEGRLVMVLGDRKIDIILKDARTPEQPIHRAAREQGVLL
ncbi:MAG: nucleotidyltransferase domain-containing protein [Rhodocyclaceae bacterium]|nr:nucleotidyltransferase domain-containing protein [Rhodocyclaceae bacterium]